MRSALIVAGATLAIAGCGATSSVSGHGGGSGSGAPVQPHTTNQLPILHPLTPEQVAQHLIDAARVPVGAVSSATAPTSGLRRPPSLPEVGGRIVRSHWWRINQPSQSAYSWIARHQSPSLHRESSGSTGGPALSDREMNVDFTAVIKPLTINSAMLTIAVAPLTATTSAIGAYAIVVRQPVRPAAENVPLTVDTATVSARRTAMTPGRGATFNQASVTGLPAQTLVREFDALPVQPPGEVFSCPALVSIESVTFRSGSHVWTATDSGCGGIGVTVDGHRSATLEATPPFTAALSAALQHRVRQPMVTVSPVR